MKTNLILTTLLSFSLSVNAQDASVSSPDGKLKVDFNLRNGAPTYSVTYGGQQMLDESPLGFVASIGDFSRDLSIKDKKTDTYKFSYALTRSKHSNIAVEANGLTVTLQNAKKQSYSIDFRVSNNDIAFRYSIPNQPDKANGQKYSMRIMQEKTGFDFPHTTTTFICPQSNAMIGWKGTKPSYEEEYVFDAPMTTKSQYGKGYTFPCLFRVPVETTVGKKTTTTDHWVLVSETGTDSRYCGCRLSEMKGDGLYTVEFPMQEENNGNGTAEPAFSLPNTTPWRTITVGSTLKPIVETTVAWDWVEPLYQSDKQYKYGKSAWHWIVWQDDMSSWDNQIAFIDLAAEMGYPYALVDAGWDQCIGYDRMPALVEYARKKNVELFLWYSSSGWWNDIIQTPINVMSNPIKRKQDMKWMQSLGIKGIKVDFFGGDKQETIRLYEQILTDADDNGLMVIFHGCTLPRGWERMYPNYVGSEAVLASENIYFNQHFADVEAQNTALHPFLRNTVGCMEFGGCFMNRHIHRGNKGGNTRRTTDCHELATTVLFQNPIQNFAITPENLGAKAGEALDYNAPEAPAPKLCIDYLRDVPTTWNETRFLDGYPGKYVVLARRSGNQWYIAGNNATGAPLTLTLPLDMVQKNDQLTLYSDNIKTREPQKTTVKYNGKALTVTLADQGGFVVVK